jgi:hypothetical protein
MTENCNNVHCDYCYATVVGNSSQSDLYPSLVNIHYLLYTVAKYLFVSNWLVKLPGYDIKHLSFVSDETELFAKRYSLMATVAVNYPAAGASE